DSVSRRAGGEGAGAGADHQSDGRHADGRGPAAGRATPGQIAFRGRPPKAVERTVSASNRSRSRAPPDHDVLLHASYPALVLSERLIESLSGSSVTRHVVRRVDEQPHAALTQNLGDRRDGHPHHRHERHRRYRPHVVDVILERDRGIARWNATVDYDIGDLEQRATRRVAGDSYLRR